MKRTKYKITICILIIALALLSQPAYAEIINVPDDFESIQGAIDESEDGDTVLVQPGEYVENINFEGKAITVASLILTTGNEAYIDSTIINGDEESSVVRFDHEEDENSILTGFTLTNGSGSPDIDNQICGGGIHCRSSSPMLTHLKICGNSAMFGGGIFLQISSPTIEYAEIYDNTVTLSGGGVYFSREGADPIVRRSVIYGNSARDYGGGIGCWNGAQPVLINITVVFNEANRGGGGMATNSHTTDNYVTLINSIVRGNEPTQIHIRSLSGDRDTLAVSFSDIEEGRDGILLGGRSRLIWGEGNIDENPEFINTDENDYHLTAESPCINAGNPDSPEDPNGSRAEIGAYYFEGGVLLGYVFDAADSAAIEGASVSTSIGYSTETDDRGFWQMAIHIAEFDITAHRQGYLDSTFNDLNIEPSDTSEINFFLLHPEFTPSEDSLICELEAGDSSLSGFSIHNAGNGILTWQARKRLVGELAVDPWKFLQSFDTGDEVGDDRLEGVVFIDDRFYVSGSNMTNRADSANMIYILDRDGNLLDRYEQLGESNFGMRHLTWDGELIWGSVGQTVYGFTIGGDRVYSFEGPYNRNDCLTWDSDHEVLWLTRSNSEIIRAYDREGNEREDLAVEHQPLSISGIVYYPEDTDGYNLYILKRNDERAQVILKMNPTNGDTMFVALLYPEGGDIPGGAFMTNHYDMRCWVYMNIAKDGSNDRIDIWQVEGNTSWMRLEPNMGEIEVEASQDMSLSIFTEGLTIDFWEAELVFNHNSASGETILPVTLTIRPDAVDPCEEIIPVEFGITGIYPNPFNSTTRITFSVSPSLHVSLSLYDLTGRELVTLIDEDLQAGVYNTGLNATNLPSGLYFVRLEASAQVLSRKLILIK
ncbi:MAG: T9SS type A sorting domain-containing protein [Candidatus Hatepunaea meridiana]|nr:T9SS type A sorting domain-containing protein [Candidatus Hatepunaea meridiana]